MLHHVLFAETSETCASNCNFQKHAPARSGSHIEFVEEVVVVVVVVVVVAAVVVVVVAVVAVVAAVVVVGGRV